MREVVTEKDKRDGNGLELASMREQVQRRERRQVNINQLSC